jgi:L-fuculose-phosphate aldolase
MDEAALRGMICKAAKRLWDRGLIGACEGNISCRLPGGRLLATPSGADKSELREADLVITDLDGVPIGDGRPSSEIAMHVRVYHERSDCGAVVHAHPPICTGFGLAGRTIPDNVLPEAGYVLGPVALVPFAIPGTPELGEAMAPFLKNHKTFILAHHGAVALGETVLDACDRMETMERVAQIVLVSEILGNTPTLPREGVEWLKKVGTGPRFR